jgi:hypothetical protein
MDVEDLHPIRSEHITDVIPPLKCFQFCGCLRKKKNFRDAMRAAIVSELREEYEPRKGEIPVIPANEQHAEGSPFQIAGYGVNSFFDIMKNLIYLFLVITLVIFPVMLIYKNNPEQGVRGLDKTSWKTSLNTVTLGNLGGAQTHCMTKRLDFDDADSKTSMKLTCPNGAKARIVQKHLDKSRAEAEVFKAGVMAFGLDERNYCDNDKIFSKDPVTGVLKNVGKTDCSTNFNKEYVHEALTACTDMSATGFCELNLVDAAGKFLMYTG